MATVIPYLSVRDAAAAIDFYKDCFGAELVPPTLRFPDGRIAHAEMTIDGAAFFLSEEAPEMGGPSPQTLGGASVRLNLDVKDVDQAVERAQHAGAEIVFPPADQFYGRRDGRIRDPFGHLWIIGKDIEDVSEEEMQRRLNEMMKKT